VHAIAPRMTTMMCEPPEKAGSVAAVDGARVKVLDLRRDLLDGDHLDGNGLRVAHRNTSLIVGRSPGASASTMTPM
jgi:hypothetical protein